MAGPVEASCLPGVWQTAVTELVRLPLRYARGRGLVPLAAHPPHPRNRPHTPTGTGGRLDAPAGTRLAARPLGGAIERDRRDRRPDHLVRERQPAARPVHAARPPQWS